MRKPPVRIKQANLASTQQNMADSWKAGATLGLIQQSYGFSTAGPVLRMLKQYHELQPLFGRWPQMLDHGRPERMPKQYQAALRKFGPPATARVASVVLPPVMEPTVTITDEHPFTLAEALHMAHTLVWALESLQDIPAPEPVAPTPDRDALFDMMADFFTKANQ